VLRVSSREWTDGDTVAIMHGDICDRHPVDVFKFFFNKYEYKLTFQIKINPKNKLRWRRPIQYAHIGYIVILTVGRKIKQKQRSCYWKININDPGQVRENVCLLKKMF
jgi:hypothetical protein